MHSYALASAEKTGFQQQIEDGRGRCRSRGRRSFQAPDDLGLEQSPLSAAFGVGAASGVVAESVDHDDVEGLVGVAVAASVEPMSMNAAAAGRDRGDTAQVGERSFGGNPVGVVAGGGRRS